jgi:hypothetical protein
MDAARPDREPVARRRFRHPGTGHEAALVVERGAVAGVFPRVLVWKVWTDEAPGSPPAVVAQRYMSVHETVESARREFAERRRALRAAGYERVD